jgi:aerobic-type carbon monoxide dehydrogenase small subunit (CoxS/CutS family)
MLLPAPHCIRRNTKSIGKLFLGATRCYCTAGFLNQSQVLLERLARKRVPRAALEKTIAEALDGHLCRCTGYIKYHEAVRDLILADPQRYLV